MPIGSEGGRGKGVRRKEGIIQYKGSKEGGGVEWV